jgi:hypothetical protein
MSYDAVDYVLLLGLPAAGALGFHLTSLRRMGRVYRTRIASGEPLTHIVGRKPAKPSSLAMVGWGIAATGLLAVVSAAFPEFTSVTPTIALTIGLGLSALLCLGANFRLSRLAISHFKL